MTADKFTALIHQEGESFVSLCPELDVASQGDTIEEAVANLKEAVELFLEVASKEELSRRLKGNIIVTQFEAVHA
jgi:predicted RNase H-like HicB family nuclease